MSGVEMEGRGYDLKAVNPHRKVQEDQRTPEELLALVEARAREAADALSVLKRR